MSRPTILPDGHPAANINLAWYLFSVGEERLLWVLAKRASQVDVIEWAAMQGLLAPKCQLRSRVSPMGTEDVINIGIRGENDDVVLYADFMLDMIDLTTIQEIFFESLLPDEQAYVLQKLNTSPEVSTAMITLPVKPDVEHEKLVGALVGLGFNKGQVNKFAGQVNTRLGVEKIENLIREGISQLS